MHVYACTNEKGRLTLSFLLYNKGVEYLSRNGGKEKYETFKTFREFDMCCFYGGWM